MRPGTRQLRRLFLGALLLFVGSMLSITAYTLWLLRADAMTAGFGISAMHTRGFEDFLTQTLNVTELAAANTVASDKGKPNLHQINSAFVGAIRQAPFLRSMSLLDENRRIIVSSNPANLGITVQTENYLPPATESQEILRIGQPWAGRDFYSGRPSTAQSPVEADANSFIPVTRTVVLGDQRVSVLIALNPDYFINQISQTIDAKEGTVEILRYDGTLLGATDPNEHVGSLRSDLMREMRLSEVESGQFERSASNGRPGLLAFRASRLYPFAVVTQINRDFALRNWVVEAKTLLGIVITLLLAISLLAKLFYRRQLQLAEQRVENERLQRINATVFYSSAEATLITDLNDKIISVNAAFSRITGYTADELIGRHLFEFFTDESIAAFTEKMPKNEKAEMAAAQTDSGPLEVQQRCKDGRLIWCEILSTPEHDENCTVVGYHRISRNISERKAAEAELEQYRHNLEELVASRTAELESTNQSLTQAKIQAEAANRAKSTFLATMSHELRTPMNGIMGMTHVAILGATDPKQKNQLGTVIKSSERLLGIINDILDFSKMESDNFVLEKVDFNLTTALESFCSLNAKQASDKGLHLIADSAPELKPLTLRGDAQRLTQVLGHLTRNAIQFTAQGSVIIRARVEEESSADVLVRFEVQDTGTGISVEEQKHLFSTFEQIDGSMTRTHGGIGLGLALSQRLVQAMNGQIGVDSAAGSGSTFWFTARLAKVA